MTKYKLKDDVNFEIVNKKTVMKYDFDLTDYYDKNTRVFKLPNNYVAFQLLGQVFVDLLVPLDLVEVIKDE